MTTRRHPESDSLVRPARTEAGDDRREKRRRRGQIEQPIATRLALRVDAVEPLGQARTGLGIPQLALDVVRPGGQPLPQVALEVTVDVLRDLPAQVRPERRVVVVPSAEPDDGECIRQQLLPRQVVEGRHQLAHRQIAAGAEDHHRVRSGRRRVPIACSLSRHGSYFLAALPGSTWPPNFSRIADSTFSANVWSCRERNRA